MEPFADSEPKISIISISRNEAPFLRAHIESVLMQDYQNFEHIVIDAESTDNTHDILREFPHLVWTSKPFTSEAALLNEGNSRATGDILGFFHVSDALASDVFQHVVKKLNDAPLAMGNSRVVDKEGSEKGLISNLPRSYPDLLKYWVFGSTPALQGCFFRNDALNAHKPKQLFSEEFTHAHEYDLSLRLAGCMPFSHYEDVLFSYKREHERDSDPDESAKLYREASRIFRRVGYKKAKTERKAAIVIGSNRVDESFEQTMKSFAKQSFADFEIIPWWTGGKGEGYDELIRFVSDLSGISNDGRYRELVGTKDEEFELQKGLKEVASSVRAPVVLFVFPGQELTETAVLEAVNSFEQDSLGALLLCGGDEELAGHLITDKEGTALFNVQALFQPISQPLSAVFRTLALQEVLESPLSDDSSVALREIYLLFQYKAWSVQVLKDGIVSTLSQDAVSPLDTQAVSGELLQAKLIDRVATVRESDSFADARSKHGFIIEFPEETVSAAREFLAKQSSGS